MSQFFASGGQSIGASATASILPMNIQGQFPLGVTDLISFLSKELEQKLIWKLYNSTEAAGPETYSENYWL